MTLNLVLVGFGNAGRRVATLLDELRPRLAPDSGFDTRVVGIATRRHGCAFAPAGLDAVAAARQAAAGQSISAFTAGGDPPSDAFDLVAQAAAARLPDPAVMVEATVLDVVTGRPAADHIRAALAAGMHVVTSNKGPIACAYQDLRAEATRAGRQLLFEGTVLDGIPLFNLVRETLPAVHVTGFRGILNTTTHHVLVSMEGGQEFSEALAAMQRAGIAEADPSLDVEGWDAAAKVAALANVLMGARLTPVAVDRVGITGVRRADVAAARGRGRRLRLVATGWLEDGLARGRVALEEIADDDPLAGLGALDNAVVLQTDLLGELAIVERGGGLTQTAYAVVTDLAALARRL